MPLVVVGETGLIGRSIKAKNLFNTLDFFINEWTTKNVAISLQNLTTEWEINRSPIDLVWAAGKSNYSSNQAILDIEIEIVECFLKNLSNSGLELNSLSLISSAGSIFGGYDDELISNNTLPKPISLYGKSRLEIESKFTDYANVNGITLNIFRLTNVFGFKQTLKNSSGLLSHLISANLTRKELNIFVPLYVEQDYIDVDFVSHNLIKILEKTKSSDKLINNYIFSRNQSHSISEVISLIDKFMGRKTPFVTQQIDSGFERQSNLRFQITNDSFITKQIEQIAVSVKKLVNEMIYAKVK
jgi:dTDP-D-glucose 4,6-dehydratase